MRFAHYDNVTKELLGFYDDGIHSSIPTPNIPISIDRVNIITQKANSLNSKWILNQIGNDFIYHDDLIEYKTQKLSNIKKIFFDKFNEGVDSSLGYKLNCRREDKQNIELLIEYMNMNSLLSYSGFKDFDNISRLITLEDAQTINNELLMYGLSLYATKHGHEDAVNSASTIEDVDNIDITVGW